MPRSAVAYLADIVDACEAIDDVLSGIDLPVYETTRSIRSSVEREFIIIGEAMSALGRTDLGLFDTIPHARMIVAFRNVLTHDYAAVDDETVFAVAETDVPELRRECAVLLRQMGAAG
jgi:uncharacterized protein with HEPN domain